MGLRLATSLCPSPCLALCTSQPFAERKSRKEESTRVPAQVIGSLAATVQRWQSSAEGGRIVTLQRSSVAGVAEAGLKGILSESDLHTIPSLAHDQNL